MLGVGAVVLAARRAATSASFDALATSSAVPLAVAAVHLHPACDGDDVSRVSDGSLYAGDAGVVPSAFVVSASPITVPESGAVHFGHRNGEARESSPAPTAAVLARGDIEGTGYAWMELVRKPCGAAGSAQWQLRLHNLTYDGAMPLYVWGARTVQQTNIEAGFLLSDTRVADAMDGAETLVIDLYPSVVSLLVTHLRSGDGGRECSHGSHAMLFGFA